MNRCQKSFCETQKRDFCNDLRVVNVVSFPVSLKEHTVRHISNSATEYCSHFLLSFMRPTVLDWIIEPSATRSKNKAKVKEKKKSEIQKEICKKKVHHEQQHFIYHHRSPSSH